MFLYHCYFIIIIAVIVVVMIITVIISLYALKIPSIFGRLRITEGFKQSALKGGAPFISIW